MTDKDDLERSVDCVTDQERDFAQNALTEFQKFDKFCFSNPTF